MLTRSSCELPVVLNLWLSCTVNYNNAVHVDDTQKLTRKELLIRTLAPVKRSYCHASILFHATPYVRIK